MITTATKQGKTMATYLIQIRNAEKTRHTLESVPENALLMPATLAPYAIIEEMTERDLLDYYGTTDMSELAEDEGVPFAAFIEAPTAYDAITKAMQAA